MRRVTDVAVLAPAPTVLASPTFPGAAGAAWPAVWTTTTGSPAGSVTQDGAGYGQLQANNASAWNASVPTAKLTTGLSAVNMELTGRFKTPGTGGYVPQFWPALGIGVTSAATVNTNAGNWTTGITIITALGNAVWSVVGSDGTNLSGDIQNPSGSAWVQQTEYAYRLRRTVANGVGTISARLWVASAAEPTAWNWSGTTTVANSLVAGSIAFQSGQGGDTEARPIKHRMLVVTDAAS